MSLRKQFVSWEFETTGARGRLVNVYSHNNNITQILRRHLMNELLNVKIWRNRSLSL